jgi:DNA-binding response OmpR family regulator
MTSSHVRAPQARILVVADDPETARLAVRILGMQGGFDVTHTADLAMGLRLIRSKPADLVVVSVPVPSLVELLDELSREDPLVPVAVLAAPGSSGDAVRALRGRADGLIRWPSRPEPLIAAAAGLIERGRGHAGGPRGGAGAAA